jgi:SNF2 family DNA or RNA helicase
MEEYHQRFEVGDLIFARESTQQEFDNAKVLQYNEDNSQILIQWLQGGRKLWLDNIDNLTRSSSKRQRQPVKLLSAQSFSTFEPVRPTNNQPIKKPKKSKIFDDLFPPSDSDSDASAPSVNPRPRRNVPTKSYTEDISKDNDTDIGDDFEEEPRIGDEEKSSSVFNSSDDSENEDELILQETVSKTTSSEGISSKEFEQATQESYRSLSRHQEVLEPFVAPRILNKIQQHQVGNGSKDVDDEVVSQPKGLVDCTMRSYQIEGLSWLYRQYKSCINSILADEMGLGKYLD